MIVVDSNILVYLWLPGMATETAQMVWQQDDNWHVPILWRSELRNVLVGYLRRGALDFEAVETVMQSMEETLKPNEHLVQSTSVLALARASNCSTYDCEFVALAEALSVPLVTEDKVILKAFPKWARTMKDFLTAN